MNGGNEARDVSRRQNRTLNRIGEKNQMQFKKRQGHAELFAAENLMAENGNASHAF